MNRVSAGEINHAHNDNSSTTAWDDIVSVVSVTPLHEVPPKEPINKNTGNKYKSNTLANIRWRKEVRTVIEVSPNTRISVMNKNGDNIVINYTRDTINMLARNVLCAGESLTIMPKYRKNGSLPELKDQLRHMVSDLLVAVPEEIELPEVISCTSVEQLVNLKSVLVVPARPLSLIYAPSPIEVRVNILSNSQWRNKGMVINTVIDNNILFKGYEPITYNGQTKSLRQWCVDLALNYSTVYRRLKTGWTVEQSFLKKLHLRKNQDILYKGKHITLKELCVVLGLKYTTVYTQIRKGKLTVNQLIAKNQKRE